MLIQPLRDREAHLVIQRTDHQEIRPRVDYALTPFGKGFAEALEPPCGWTEGGANSGRIAESLG